MPSSMLAYYEWMRIRLGIRTPKDARVVGASVGDEPPWEPEPSNYKLKDFIRTACKTVNQHVGLTGDGTLRSLSVAAQTAAGPFTINLASVSGYRDRSIISIRRMWWNDGSVQTRLIPVSIAEKDRANSSYISDAAAVPVVFSIEGYTLSLFPSPASAGTLQFMATSGILAPDHDEEPFEGIPEVYDQDILYIAIVDYGKSLPADSEMAGRAAAYTSDAAAGLDKFKEWFGGGSNEEVQSDLIFDASAFRRNARRR